MTSFTDMFIKNNVCTRVTNRFSATRGLFWCLFHELRSNGGNEYQNNTRVSPEAVRHESTDIILFHDIANPLMMINTKSFTHLPRVSLVRFSFCWWRRNRLLMTSQWPDNCDAITWIVISNSLDIDFIHGDIHVRSCKKRRLPTWNYTHTSDLCVDIIVRPYLQY